MAEQPPSQINLLPEIPGAAQISFGFQMLPPMRRTWMLEPSGQFLIQIQDGLFSFNWKRTSDSDVYPRFDTVFKRFNYYFEAFQSFLKAEGIGGCITRQFELSYVNMLHDANGLRQVAVGDAFRDHRIANDSSRILPDPISFAWNTTYPLPEKKGQLSVNAMLGPLMVPRAVRLDITAQGLSSDQSEIGRRVWFELAHEWVNEAFVETTNSELHAVWGKE